MSFFSCHVWEECIFCIDRILNPNEIDSKSASLGALTEIEHQQLEANMKASSLP